MKTTYISSLNPLRICQNPDPDVLKYFDTLTNDDGFKQAQSVLHSYLPQLSSFSIKTVEGKNLLEHPLFQDHQLKAIWEQTAGATLHLGKVSSFTDIYLLVQYFNLCYTDLQKFEVQDIDLHFARNRQEIQEISNNYPSEKLTALFIPFNLSKTRVKQWIDENWNSIQDDISELPNFNAHYIPKNLEPGYEITNLRAQEKTFEEISEIMYERHPDDDRLADYGHVKTLYHRYQEHIPQAFISALIAKSLKRNTK